MCSTPAKNIIKFRYCEKATNIWRNLPLDFSFTYLVNIIPTGTFCQILVVFLKNLNCTRILTSQTSSSVAKLVLSTQFPVFSWWLGKIYFTNNVCHTDSYGLQRFNTSCHQSTIQNLTLPNLILQEEKYGGFSVTRFDYI